MKRPIINDFTAFTAMLVGIMAKCSNAAIGWILIIFGAAIIILNSIMRIRRMIRKTK